jgi:hypothetical protein
LSRKRIPEADLYENGPTFGGLVIELGDYEDSIVELRRRTTAT